MVKALPAMLTIVFVALKLSLVVAVRASFDGWALHWIFYADPIPVWAAEKLTSLSFDQRRILPTREEALVFDVALLAFTALQWFGLGLVLSRWLGNRLSTDEQGRGHT